MKNIATITEFLKRADNLFYFEDKNLIEMELLTTQYSDSLSGLRINKENRMQQKISLRVLKNIKDKIAVTRFKKEVPPQDYEDLKTKLIKTMNEFSSCLV